ncbi:MAG: hypothetical protein Q27BPR15_15795 [Rhodobacter sp. CACIA14H1]|nr:MAG: hypothetical protein Q27BPR15_15795 [Rhodobacter sp. CACIA14H1]
MAEIPPPKSESTVRLRENGVGLEGRKLGLKGGELLLAINGRPFRGDDDVLHRRFEARGSKPLVLTFQRGDDEFVVLAETGRLGRWDIVAAGPAGEDGAARIDPEGLRNFEVLRSEKGVYDLYPAVPPNYVLLTAPVWLLQMRIWIPGSTLAAALAAAGLVSPWLALVVWVAAGLWVRRAAAYFVRADRRSRGLSWEGVITARTEAEAHARHLARYPGDRNLFAPEGDGPGEEAEVA